MSFQFNWFIFINKVYRHEIRCHKVLLLFPNCAKTHLPASAIPKFFQGCTWTPLSGEGRGFETEGERRIAGIKGHKGGEVVEGRDEGGKAKEKEKQGGAKGEGWV
jgi:hypothetical protein